MCGGIAALAVGFAEFFGYFFPSFSTQSYLLQFEVLGFSYSLSAGQLIIGLFILLLGIPEFLFWKTRASDNGNTSKVKRK